ncbi:MAG TPA: hypothetical protein VJC03_02205, partial [bacterium]|nr:hypothetical protein [bacterium]
EGERTSPLSSYGPPQRIGKRKWVMVAWTHVFYDIIYHKLNPSNPHPALSQRERDFQKASEGPGYIRPRYSR